MNYRKLSLFPRPFPHCHSQSESVTLMVSLIFMALLAPNKILKITEIPESGRYHNEYGLVCEFKPFYQIHEQLFLLPFKTTTRSFFNLVAFNFAFFYLALSRSDLIYQSARIWEESQVTEKRYTPLWMRRFLNIDYGIKVNSTVELFKGTAFLNVLLIKCRLVPEFAMMVL